MVEHNVGEDDLLTEFWNIVLDNTFGQFHEQFEEAVVEC